MTTVLQRFLNIRREEVAPLLVAMFYFFCVLTALMMLRPARDALGMERGMDKIRWLFIATAVVTLAVNPMFGWLVSRFRRITFITATYGFFAASLIGFYALLTLTPQAIGATSGQVFYVWFSVFNLFCTMVFWALMVDQFTLEQSKRLFGAIAVGGTVGAIFGPWLSSILVKPFGTASLLLVAAGFLMIAVVAAWAIVWLQSRRTQEEEMLGIVRDNAPQNIIGGNAWEGIRAVFRSKYLLGISAYMLILSVIATFLYFTRLQMVADLKGDTDANTMTLARIDMITQTATLILQMIVAGHLMKRFGVSVALALLPVLMVFGFVGLALVATLPALVALDVTFKATQRAIMRPARETLFTIVSPEDKYKSKAFTDTFVYRGGDMIGAWTEGAISKFALGLVGLVSVAAPLAAVWAVLGIWLGRQQKRMADSLSTDELQEKEAPVMPSTVPQ